jgi:hypothetical protein
MHDTWLSLAEVSNLWLSCSLLLDLWLCYNFFNTYFLVYYLKFLSLLHGSVLKRIWFSWGFFSYLNWYKICFIYASKEEDGIFYSVNLSDLEVQITYETLWIKSGMIVIQMNQLKLAKKWDNVWVRNVHGE